MNSIQTEGIKHLYLKKSGMHKYKIPLHARPIF